MEDLHLGGGQYVRTQGTGEWENLNPTPIPESGTGRIIQKS